MAVGGDDDRPLLAEAADQEGQAVRHASLTAGSGFGLQPFDDVDDVAEAPAGSGMPPA